MSAEQIKQITKEGYAALANHDLDKFAFYMAENAVDYDPCGYCYHNR